MVYLFLVIVLRVSGKREVGQMSILELIVILVISDAVQNSMVGQNSTLWAGLFAVLTLLTLDLGLKGLTGRSRRLRKAVEGEPRLLVRDGRLLDRALREEGVEADQVRAAIRGHGLERVEDVRLAVLETARSASSRCPSKTSAPVSGAGLREQGGQGFPYARGESLIRR